MLKVGKTLKVRKDKNNQIHKTMCMHVPAHISFIHTTAHLDKVDVKKRAAALTECLSHSVGKFNISGHLLYSLHRTEVVSIISEMCYDMRIELYSALNH